MFHSRARVTSVVGAQVPVVEGHTCIQVGRTVTVAQPAHAPVIDVVAGRAQDRVAETLAVDAGIVDRGRVAVIARRAVEGVGNALARITCIIGANIPIVHRFSRPFVAGAGRVAQLAGTPLVHVFPRSADDGCAGANSIGTQVIRRGGIAVIARDVVVRMLYARACITLVVGADIAVIDGSAVVGKSSTFRVAQGAQALHIHVLACGTDEEYSAAHTRVAAVVDGGRVPVVTSVGVESMAHARVRVADIVGAFVAVIDRLAVAHISSPIRCALAAYAVVINVLAGFTHNGHTNALTIGAGIVAGGLVSVVARSNIELAHQAGCRVTRLVGADVAVVNCLSRTGEGGAVVIAQEAQPVLGHILGCGANHRNATAHTVGTGVIDGAGIVIIARSVVEHLPDPVKRVAKVVGADVSVINHLAVTVIAGSQFIAQVAFAIVFHELARVANDGNSATYTLGADVTAGIGIPVVTRLRIKGMEHTCIGIAEVVGAHIAVVHRLPVALPTATVVGAQLAQTVVLRIFAGLAGDGCAHAFAVDATVIAGGRVAIVARPVIVQVKHALLRVTSVIGTGVPIVDYFTVFQPVGTIVVAQIAHTLYVLELLRGAKCPYSGAHTVGTQVVGSIRVTIIARRLVELVTDARLGVAEVVGANITVVDLGTLFHKLSTIGIAQGTIAVLGRKHAGFTEQGSSDAVSFEAHVVHRLRVTVIAGCGVDRMQHPFDRIAEVVGAKVVVIDLCSLIDKTVARVVTQVAAPVLRFLVFSRRAMLEWDPVI